METLDGFQRRAGNVGFSFDFDGDYQILVLQEEINFIAVVTAGPIA